MTARTCPVHGEYSESGACRWCEPGAPEAPIAREGTRFIAELPPGDTGLTWMGAKVVFDPNSDRFDPVLVSWKPVDGLSPKSLPESAVAKAARSYFATRAGMAPLFSTRQRYSTPEGVASHAAFWEARLEKEHAALRWERVARRWNYKHRSWLNEEGRARVWMHWLDQMNRRFP